MLSVAPNVKVMTIIQFSRTRFPHRQFPNSTVKLPDRGASDVSSPQRKVAQFEHMQKMQQ